MSEGVEGERKERNLLVDEVRLVELKLAESPESERIVCFVCIFKRV